MSLDVEKCPHCGATVKKQNLKGHTKRMHLKQLGQDVKSLPVARPRSFVRSHRRRNVLILAVVLLAVVGVSAAVAAMIDASTMKMHIHPTVSATINGNPFAVPAQIGIERTLWLDHSLDRHGMQGMSPLHTHDDSNTIHVESNTIRDFTLHEFLAVWGKSIDNSQVLGHFVDPGHRAYIVVDGVERPASDDVVFVDGMEIRLVCGP